MTSPLRRPPAPGPRLAAAAAAGLAAPLAAPLAALLVMLAGCPGGGATPAPTRVTLTLALHGAGATSVHGLDAVVALPAGALVAHEPASGRVAAVALRLEAAAASGVVDGRFTPHPRAPSLRLLVASGAAMTPGPLVSVTLTVPGGVPAPSAFEVVSSVAAGQGGAAVASAGVMVVGVTAVE